MIWSDLEYPLLKVNVLEYQNRVQVLFSVLPDKSSYTVIIVIKPVYYKL